MIEEKFREFGESSSEFVKRVSAERGFTYRGDSRSIEDNLTMMKKVFGKWSVEIILTTYSLKSVGFGDLRRVLKGISPQGISSRVLSKKLKDLEELGFIERNVIESRPPKVRYALSRRGELVAKLGEPVILYLRNSVE